MLSFADYKKELIAEAIKSADISKASKLILAFLNKKLKTKVALMPMVDGYKTPEGMMSSITYMFANGTGYLRFNWLAGKIDSASLHSVTWMDQSTKNKISFDKNVSLVNALPHIVDIVNKGKKGEFEFFTEEALDLEAEMINEEEMENPLDTIKHVLDTHKVGDKIPVSNLKLSSVAYKVLRQLIQDNPRNFNKYTILSKDNLSWKGVEALLAKSRVWAKVQKDSSRETWTAPIELKGMQGQVEEQISYMEKVEDLSNMIKFMVKGATNAVFVAGRGGTGKTQTVEDTLEEIGLTDGNGFFKITGSASPAAVYETLFKNRKGVILFDDCDGALDSQDGRNLIKAATDTKRVRKVAWMKKGKNYYDPQYEEEPEDDDIGDMLPRYFDFTGKIIFISNLTMKKLDPDGALKTRGMMIEMNPTNMDMIDFMGVIYEKVAILEEGNMISKEKRKEVLEAIRPVIAKREEYTANLRLLVRAMNLAATGLPGWERMLKYI